MRTSLVFVRSFTARFGLIIVILMTIFEGCTKNVNAPEDSSNPSTSQSQSLEKHHLPSLLETDLVADVASLGAVKIDSALKNAWGIAMTPNGRIWISSNHASVSVIYDQDGNTIRPPVTIPTKDNSSGGAPTGVIFNPTQGFVIPQTGEISRFIFVGEDGIVSAWSSGSSAKVVADRSSSEAVYKGLAMASDGGADFLYAADFKGGKIDVFDDHFQQVTTKPFVDHTIPAGFAPFNVQNIDGKLYVTYALQKGPDNEDDQAGPGNGFVNIFRPDGSLERRFASHGKLDSPWGLAEVRDHTGNHLKHRILVGNFGDGRINIFSRHGKHLGQLSDTHGNPVTIFGLWGLSFGSVPVVTGHQGHEKGNNLPRLFFTAGPNDEENGLFGYLQIQRGGKELEDEDSELDD